MLDFRKVTFLTSAPDYSGAPFPHLPEVLVVGRSNVGKSSLINALCDHKNLAYTSSTPGHTRLLNFFDVDATFHMVDAPGYGYTASGSKHTDSFARMMEDYFGQSKHLKGVLFLVDARHAPSKDDADFYRFLVTHALPAVIVLTKADTLNQSQKAKIHAQLTQAFGLLAFPVLLTSAEKKSGMPELRSAIEKMVR